MFKTEVRRIIASETFPGRSAAKTRIRHKCKKKIVHRKYKEIKKKNLNKVIDVNVEKKIFLIAAVVAIFEVKWIFFLLFSVSESLRMCIISVSVSHSEQGRGEKCVCVSVK